MNIFENVKKFVIENYGAFDYDDSVRVMFGNKKVHYSWFPGPGTIQVTISNNSEMKIDAVSIKEMNLDEIVDFQTHLRGAVGLMDFVKKVFENNTGV